MSDERITDIGKKLGEKAKGQAMELFEKAGIAYQKGDLEEAAELLEDVTKLDTTLAEAWLTRSTILELLNRDKEALKCAEEAIELNRRNQDAWLNKGIAILKLGRRDDAIEAFEIGLAINKKNSGLWYWMGRAFMEMPAVQEKALAYFEKAEKLEPADIDIKHHKVVALMDLEKWREALKCYDEIIKLAPNDTVAWINKAIILGNLNEYVEAERVAEKALELARKGKEKKNEERALDFLDRLRKGEKPSMWLDARKEFLRSREQFKKWKKRDRKK